MLVTDEVGPTSFWSAETAPGFGLARVRAAPLVLVDLLTEQGVTGRSYVFCYTPVALGAVVGLLGPQGLTGMAMAGIDMAAWDALARAAGLPLVRLLGGDIRPVPAYGSLRTMDPAGAAREAEELIGLGVTTFKIKVGLSGIEADTDAVRAIRGAVGHHVPVAVDYNQCLTVPEAIRRSHALEEERLLWIEEPTRAEI